MMTRSNRGRGWLSAVVPATVMLAAMSGPAGAETLDNDALQIELNEMAKQIKSVIDKRGGGAVAVGGFSAASSIRGSSGPEIQIKLQQALQSLKPPVVVNSDVYRFEVLGNYLPFVDQSTKLEGVKVVGRVVDAGDGLTLAEFPRFVFGEETVPRLLGLSVHTPPTNDPKVRSDAFKDAGKNPHSSAEGSRISNRGSPYAIELLVKKGVSYVARKAAADSNGRPFVPINKNEVYGIRLINDSNHEAAVRLTIDGVNVLEFTELKSRPKFWVIPAGRKADILGWHKNQSHSLEFKVTEFPDTAAAKIKLKPSPSIGSITASFSAAWEMDSDKPADELRSRGTGFGEEITFKTKTVERSIGRTRDSITVRYER